MMKITIGLSLIALCIGFVVTAFGQNNTNKNIRQVDTVEGIVIGYSLKESLRNPTSGIQTRCYQKLLFQVNRGNDQVNAGEYIMLKYDTAYLSEASNLPNQIYSGTNIWEFRLKGRPIRSATLREMIEYTEDLEHPEGRWVKLDDGSVIGTAGYYSDIQMFLGRDVRSLPMNSIVKEFEFDPQDYRLLSE